MRGATLVALLALAGCGAPPAPEYAGPTYAVDADRVSVSGIAMGSVLMRQGFGLVALS